MAEIIDQQNTGGSSNAGFGEFSGTRYRGQGFTPSLASFTALAFQLSGTGSKDVKVYIDTADSNSIPTNSVGSEVYSWTIANASLSASLAKYTAPAEQALTAGSQYCYYLAPFSSGSYSDDYRDAVWTNSNSYSGGKPIVNSAGTWSVSDSGNLDANFRTYGNQIDDGIISHDTPSNSGVQDGNSSFSFSHTINANDNRVLVVGIALRDPGATVTSVKWNTSETLTGLTAVDVGSSTARLLVQLFYLVNPTAGTYNIDVVLSEVSSTIGVGAISLYEANQTGQPEANNGNSGSTGTTSTVTVNSVSQNSYVIGVMYSKVGATVTLGADQHSICQLGVNGGGDRMVMSYKDRVSSGNIIMTESWTGNEDWATQALAIKTVAGAATSVKDLIMAGIIPFSR